MPLDSTRRAALIASLLSAFLTPFMGSALNIALPSIGREMSMSAVALSWVATSFLLAAAALQLPVGRLADIYGRKRVFTYGVAIFTVAALLTGLAPNAASLLACRALQGIGGAMIFGTGVAILTSVFPLQERGRVLGMNVATVYLGLSLGPFLGGLLTQQFGWRSIFFVTVPLGLITLAFVLWQLEGEWAEARGEGFDLVGSVIYCLALSAVLFGFSRLATPLGMGMVVLGAAGIIGFLAWETRAASPIFDIRLFRRNQAFLFSNLAALINYAATTAVGFLLSLFLQYIKGLTPQMAGLVLIAQPAMQALFSPLAGRLSDRVEPRIVASAGMGLTVVGLALLTQLGADTGLPFILAVLLLLGVGFALFSSPNTNAIMSSVDRRFYGIASGMVGTMRQIGQTLSLGIAALVFALYIGKGQITPELYPMFVRSAHAAFVILTLLCVLGIFASLARGQVRAAARASQ